MYSHAEATFDHVGPHDCAGRVSAACAGRLPLSARMRVHVCTLYTKSDV